MKSEHPPSFALAPTMPHFNIIAAIGQRGQMGLDGALPWRCPEDLRLFKRVTSGGAVIMGRRTWESLNARGLPDRKVIVVSRSLAVEYGDAYASLSFAGALHAVSDVRPHGWIRDGRDGPYLPAGGRWVCGGAQIYREALCHAEANLLLLSRIAYDGPADTFFPLDALAGWHCTHTWQTCESFRLEAWEQMGLDGRGFPA